MNFESLNKGSAFAGLDIKLEEIENMRTCQELAAEEKPSRVVAVMFSEKGEYGKSAFLVCADEKDELFTTWLPKHMVKTCEELVENGEAVNGILAGRCGVRGEAYQDKKGVTRYTVRWCNL